MISSLIPRIFLLLPLLLEFPAPLFSFLDAFDELGDDVDALFDAAPALDAPLFALLFFELLLPELADPDPPADCFSFLSLIIIYTMCAPSTHETLTIVVRTTTRIYFFTGTFFLDSLSGRFSHSLMFFWFSMSESSQTINVFFCFVSFHERCTGIRWSLTAPSLGCAQSAPVSGKREMQSTSLHTAA